MAAGRRPLNSNVRRQGEAFVRIRFRIGDLDAEFHRSTFWGHASIKARGTAYPLNSLLNPATHFSASLVRVWALDIEGHAVRVEKTRPLLLAGFRPNAYRIFVDDQMAAQASGY